MTRFLLLFISLSLVMTTNPNHCLDIAIGNGFCLSKNRNELYFSRPTLLKGEKGKTIYSLYVAMKDSSGGWSEGSTLSFGELNYVEYHPELNHEQNRLYYVSRRPEPGTSFPVPYANLWYVERTQSGWSAPIFLKEINHKGQDSYPSFSAKGTLYFNSDRPGGKGGMDIYKSELKQGQYQQPQLLKIINSSDSENDLVVHPDEKWIIFNRYVAETGELDLYIAFNQDGQWSQPQSLDLINRPRIFELTPSLSPDLKTFYYEVNGKVMCVAMESLLKSLKQ